MPRNRHSNCDTGGQVINPSHKPLDWRSPTNSIETRNDRRRKHESTDCKISGQWNQNEKTEKFIPLDPKVAISLLEDWQEELTRMLSAKNLPKADWEDIVAEAAIKILEHSQSREKKGEPAQLIKHPRAYARRIINNCIADFWKKRKRLDIVSLSEEASGDTNEDLLTEVAIEEMCNQARLNRNEREAFEDMLESPFRRANGKGLTAPQRKHRQRAREKIKSVLLENAN